ncbi:MAG: phosphate uptake regulator PhoU [Thaumarchaeota archaeon]|nr:phosphate uptake regulator PhoU [Nitrososphaerota archaeon]
MSELRKVQEVGYSTLAVSIPADMVRNLKIRKGDNLLISEEADGTLKLAPASRPPKTVKASIKADAVANEDILSRVVVGCYMLGYDAIELTSKDGINPSYLARGSKTLRSLRGVEIVESSGNRLVAQSFMDPTKFPVDSLIKRLQLLVSRSLENAIEALRTGSPALLKDIKGIQEEVQELYWLIVRQLLVALSNRDISGKIGLESPLHTSGDRVSAKTIEEIGRLVLELTEEVVSSRERGIQVQEKVLAKIESLARMAQESFEVTMESLLTPDIRTIERATLKIDGALRVEREMMGELLQSEYAYVRTTTSDLGQLARYCSIILEISLNRLLRKTSRICTIQTQ